MKEKLRPYLVVGTNWGIWISFFIFNGMITVIFPALIGVVFLSAATIGVVMSINRWGNAIGRVSSSFFPRLIGIKRIIVISTIISAIANLLLSFSTDLILIATTTTIINFAWGFFKPTAYGLSMEAFPKRKTYVVAFLETATSFGMLIGAGFVGWLIDAGYGWQKGIQILIFFILIMFVLAFIILKEPSGKKQAKPVEEEKPVPEEAESAGQEFHIPAWILGLLVVAPVEECGAAYSLLLPLFLLDKFELSVGTMALIYGVSMWLGLFGKFVVAFLADRLGKLKTMILTPFVVGLSFIGVLFSPSVPFLFAFLILKALFEAYWVLLPSLIGDIFTLQRRIKVLGTMEFLGFLLMGLYPPVQGWMIDNIGVTLSWIFPIVLMFASSLINIVCYLWFKKQGRMY